MTFSGDLVDYPLAELLFFLSANHRSGWLTIQSDAAEIKFSLLQGQLVAVNSDDIQNRLGQRLIEDGHITGVQLDTALAIQRLRHPPEALGSTLVKLGYARVEDVQYVLRAQAVDLMFKILIQPPSLFFYDRGLPEVHEIEVGVALERDVLEAIRRADEWITQQLWASTVRLNPETSADMLLGVIAQDWPTVEAIMDGAVTVDEIAALTGWSLQESHDSLRRLQSLDIIFITNCYRPRNDVTRILSMPIVQSDIPAAVYMD